MDGFSQKSTILGCLFSVRTSTILFGEQIDYTHDIVSPDTYCDGFEQYLLSLIVARGCVDRQSRPEIDFHPILIYGDDPGNMVLQTSSLSRERLVVFS